MLSAELFECSYGGNYVRDSADHFRMVIQYHYVTRASADLADSCIQILPKFGSFFLSSTTLRDVSNIPRKITKIWPCCLRTFSNVLRISTMFAALWFLFAIGRRSSICAASYNVQALMVWSFSLDCPRRAHGRRLLVQTLVNSRVLSLLILNYTFFCEFQNSPPLSTMLSSRHLDNLNTRRPMHVESVVLFSFLQMHARIFDVTAC